MNLRRHLMVSLAAGALAAALPALAQKGRVWRIGFLAVRSRPAVWKSDYYGAFLTGMREIGYVEGKQFAMEWRFADGNVARLPELAADLVRSKVDIIVTGGTAGARAAKQATASIPIVMANLSDPVGAGFVESLARPGGNITGLTNTSTGLSPRHLELLRAVLPDLTALAVMLNPLSENYTPILKGVSEAAQAAGIRLQRYEAQSTRGIDRAFAAMKRDEMQAVIVAFDGYYVQQRHQIASLALANRLPSMFPVREQSEAGGMMSYGQNFEQLYSRTAFFVDKIIQGAKPGDLPMEQPAKFELVINAKIAKALGVVIPITLFSQADKIIT
jgi:putative ABC transport system substrate-binding protein